MRISEPLEMLGVKVPPDVAQKIREQARADDRTISSFVRRILARAVSDEDAAEPTKREPR